ncbi:MAG: hypothetical protein QXO16_07680 [Archaeoglobaceae archaeon]
MKKSSKLGMLLLTICIAILGIYGAYIGQKSMKQLTEEEKAEVVRVALSDSRVREEIGNSEYEVGNVDMCRFEVYKEKSISGIYPCLRIYIGGKEQVGVTLVAFVDLEKGQVVHVSHEYRKELPST